MEYTELEPWQQEQVKTKFAFDDPTLYLYDVSPNGHVQGARRIDDEDEDAHVTRQGEWISL